MRGMIARSNAAAFVGRLAQTLKTALRAKKRGATVALLLAGLVLEKPLWPSQPSIVPQGPLASIHLGMSMSDVRSVLGQHAVPLVDQKGSTIASFGMPFLAEFGELRYAPQINYYDGVGHATFLFFRDHLVAIQLDRYDLSNIANPRQMSPIEKAARADFGKRFQLAKADGDDAKYTSGTLEVYLIHLPVDAGTYVRLVWRDRPLIEEMAQLALHKNTKTDRRDIIKVVGGRKQLDD